MGSVAVDLHIHSALSPCGDPDMTPNNIVGMALLKELDYIAVTDHNSARNLPAVIETARGEGICVLPGIEVTTREEAHVLTYFDKLENALALGEELYKLLPNIPNRPDFFGNQYIYDEEDEIIGEIDKLLISATSLSVDGLCKLVMELNGVIVPAHVDRKSYSLIASLGFIPPNLPIGTLEISKAMAFDEARKSFPQIAPYQLIHASDAHYLGDIAEREYYIDLPDLQKETLLQYLRKE